MKPSCYPESLGSLMKYVISVLLSFLLLGFAVASSDSTKRRDLNVRFGVIHAALSDKVFTPITYTSKSVVWGGTFLAEREYQTHRVSVGYTSLTFSNQINNNRWLVSNETIRYDYLRRINSLQLCDFRIGIGTKNYISLRSLMLSGNEETGYDVFSSLPVNLLINLKPGSRHHVSIFISTGLFAYVIGQMKAPKDWPADFTSSILDHNDSPNIGSIVKSGKVLWLDAFLDIDTVIEYDFQLAKKWGIVAQYAFNYYTYEKYERVKSADSQYQIGIKYSFFR